MKIYYNYVCRVAVCASTLLLSGCQVMSEKECLSANWYQIGFQERVEKELSEWQGKVAKAKDDEERRHLHREIRKNEAYLRQARDTLFAV